MFSSRYSGNKTNFNQAVSAFLKEKGLIAYGTNSGHTKFDYPEGLPGLMRPVIVRTKYKDIPLTHIHTNLRSLGCPKEESEKWLKDQKGKNK